MPRTGNGWLPDVSLLLINVDIVEYGSKTGYKPDASRSALSLTSLVPLRARASPGYAKRYALGANEPHPGTSHINAQ